MSWCHSSQVIHLRLITELTDDDDEILVNLAESLSFFPDLVGGSAHAFGLVKPLESLVCAEETVVRDKVLAPLLTVLGY